MRFHSPENAGKPRRLALDVSHSSDRTRNTKSRRARKPMTVAGGNAMSFAIRTFEVRVPNATCTTPIVVNQVAAAARMYWLI